MRLFGSLILGFTKRLLPPLLLAWNCSASGAYPERPITVIAPFGSGSVVETTFRVILGETSKILGQPIVIENRTGGMSRMGVLALRNAAPDGYTFSIGSDTLHVLQPILDSSFKLRPGKEYEPVAFLFSHNLVVVANQSMPFKDLKGLVAYAKAHPGKLNMAVATGSSTHFAALLFAAATSTDLTIVPYKSQNDFIPDLMSGRVDVTTTAMGLKGQTDAGQLLALATTGSSRWSAYPETPTMTELGYAMSQSVWYDVIAPAGTPRDVVTRFNVAIRQAMKTQVVVNKLKEGYFSASGSDMLPAEFVRKVDSETTTWTPILLRSGIKLQ